MQTEPTKAEPPKRKRRWFQFSLRTLLIFAVVCAIAAAWLGRKIERKYQERQAVTAIRALGGDVYYDYDTGNGSPAPGPQWMRTLLGEDFFAEVDAVVFIAVPGRIGDAELENLSGLTKTRRIWLESSRISDAGLEHLEGLTSLQDLALGGTSITDAGLVHLKRLTDLRELDLGGTGVTDAGLAQLNGMRQLRSLSLWGTGVTDAGLLHLRGLSRLDNLSLVTTKVTDAGVDSLKKALPASEISY